VGAFPVCRFPVSEKPDCERTALDRRSAIAHPRICGRSRPPPKKSASAGRVRRERFDRAHTSPHAAASTWKRAPHAPHHPHLSHARITAHERAPSDTHERRRYARSAARSLLRVTPHQVEECQDERPRHRELVRRARHEEEEEEQGACRSRDERSRDSLFATRDAPIVPSLRRPAADVSCRRRERDAKQIGGRDRETASPDRR